MVFDLSAFNLSRTDKRWFQGNRIMRNLGELTYDMDSLDFEMRKSQLNIYDNAGTMLGSVSRTVPLEVRPDLQPVLLVRDSTELATASNPDLQREIQKDRLSTRFGMTVKQRDSTIIAYRKAAISFDKEFIQGLDNSFNARPSVTEISGALSMARTVQTQISQILDNERVQSYEFRVFQIQWHKIWANSVSCLIMFLIGAPLGAIIKKGGLGVPVLTSIIFFIIFYVLSILGEKWAKQEVVSVPVGVWTANGILLIFGLIFLFQARKDARFFESDFYKVVFDRLLRRFKSTSQA